MGMRRGGVNVGLEIRAPVFSRSAGGDGLPLLLRELLARGELRTPY